MRTIKERLAKLSMSEEELRELVVFRLVVNNGQESESLYETYSYNKENKGYKSEFGDFLTEFYRDLGTDYDDCFERVEESILDNLENNYYYLD